MTIESFTDSTFTTKSDVWSFGVCFWEIFTLVREPYLGFECVGLKSWITTGYRLDQPALCPNNVFEAMNRCWNKDPNKRPTFSQLVQIFDYFVTESRIPISDLSLDKSENSKVSGYVPICRAMGYQIVPVKVVQDKMF